MAVKRKLGFCRALMVAASMTALSMGAAHAQDLNELNARILENPQDVDLNLRYARLAEQQGKPRLALAAYERVLINEPDNLEAQHGYTRMRRLVEPTHTSFRVEAGEQWDTNAADLSENREDAYSSFVRASLVDERRLGSQRWRSIVNFDEEITPQIEELNYGYLGAQTGPIVDVSPNVAAIPAVGVAVSSLDNNFYFDEINLGVTVEGREGGVSLWSRARAGWRDYGHESTATQGAFAELIGGASVSHVASEKDSLSLVPWLRWSGIKGSSFDFLNGELTPGEYTEVGLEARYNYRVNDHLAFSVGALGHDRYYSRTEVAGKDRHDTYVTPSASITLWDVVPCSCGFRLGYEHRNNRSNDHTADYDADQVSFSVFRQF